MKSQRGSFFLFSSMALFLSVAAAMPGCSKPSQDRLTIGISQEFESLNPLLNSMAVITSTIVMGLMIRPFEEAEACLTARSWSSFLLMFRFLLKNVLLLILRYKT